MLRLIGLLAVAAGAGYFTNPTEEAHRAAANQVLSVQADAAAENFDLGAMLETGAASLTQDGGYSNYYVGSTYRLEAGGHPYVECYGAFTKVICNRVGAEAEAAPASD